MNCYYCQKSLQEYSNFCKDCGAYMFPGVSNSPHSFGLHIRWEVGLEDSLWMVNIYPEINRTILSGYSYYKQIYLNDITLNFTLNVNKHNIQNRLRTILTFQ